MAGTPQIEENISSITLEVLRLAEIIACIFHTTFRICTGEALGNPPGDAILRAIAPMIDFSREFSRKSRNLEQIGLINGRPRTSARRSKNMQSFNLTSYIGDQLGSYEPLSAIDHAQAVAYCMGLLAERTRTQQAFMARHGVHYRLEAGRRQLEDLSSSASQAIGTWHFVEYYDTAEMTFRSYPEAER